MDSRIIKKMNEIIGVLKIIERELSSYSSLADKKRLINVRKPEVERKMQELDEMMSTILSDAQTINYHRQLKEEVNKVLSVNVYSPKKYLSRTAGQ